MIPSDDQPSAADDLHGQGPASPVLAQPHLNAVQSFGRWRRLATKELREILRDRRTIFTLVLMPLLLYPLLSIACRQFFMASKLTEAATEYTVGVATEAEGERLQEFLQLASWSTSSETATANADESPGTADAPAVRIVLADNLEQAVRDYSLHVGIRLEDAEQPENRADPSDVKFRGQMLYVDSSLAGKAALEYLESRFEAANRAIVVAQLRKLDLDIALEPLDFRPLILTDPEAVSTFSMVSVVIPLILILMTITGAVYPAIDLTAGERERGTLEVLVAAPVPRLTLLLAKYTAVWIVACLTATANLVMLTVTILISGLGGMLFGESGISLATVLQVFCLLLLFAAFFSAVLLALSSFARSFKEAQAYLVPLMLVSITPGMLSMNPDLELSGPLSIAPLVNIVLLARDLFRQTATPGIAAVVVVTTLLYALSAIALAARVFGAEAVLYSAQSGWSSFFRRPRTQQRYPSMNSALVGLAVLFPAHFTVNNLLSLHGPADLRARLLLSALATALLFGLVPWMAARFGNLNLSSGLKLRSPPVLGMIGSAILGVSLWPFAHEIVIWQMEWGLTSLGDNDLLKVKKVAEQLQQVNATWLLLAISVVPAVFEELFFRGFLQTALRTAMRPAAAVLTSAGLFGLFHLIATDSLTIERLFATSFLGVVLGYVCLRTDSVWPGMVLHACHNGLLVLMIHNSDRLASGTLGENVQHLPLAWLGTAALAAAVGLILVSRGRNNGTAAVAVTLA